MKIHHVDIVVGDTVMASMTNVHVSTNYMGAWISVALEARFRFRLVGGVTNPDLLGYTTVSLSCHQPFPVRSHTDQEWIFNQ